MNQDLELAKIYNDLSEIEKECLKEKFKDMTTEDIIKENDLTFTLEYLRRTYQNKLISINSENTEFNKNKEKCDADLIKEMIEQNIKKSIIKENKKMEKYIQESKSILEVEEIRKKNFWISFWIIMSSIVFICLVSTDFETNNSSTPTRESEWKSFKLSIAEDRIKNSLRDPRSYKRLNYKVNYNGDKIKSITIEYTATNGFGGTNREIQTISF